MAGFAASLVEFGDGTTGNGVDKRKPASEYFVEKKLLIEFIRNFRRGREAYYRYASNESSQSILMLAKDNIKWPMKRLMLFRRRETTFKTQTWIS